MPELAVRVRYRVRFHAAARAVAHARCRLRAVLFAGRIVVGNILLPVKAVVQGGDILGFCMGGAGAGVSPDPLFRAGGGRRHRAAVPYKVSGGIGDRFVGSSRHGTAGRVIFDFSAGVQRANIRLDLCAGYPASVRVAAAVADACARSVNIVFNAAPHLQLRVAGNGDVVSFTPQTAADACAVYAAAGTDLAAGDDDVAAISCVAAADACAVFAADGVDLAAGDSDVAAAAVLSAADACAVEAVGGPDLAAGNGDVAAVAAEAAADACGGEAADGVDPAAGDEDVAAVLSASAADARTLLAAPGGQLAVLVLVRNGQAAAVVLFKAGMLIATPERASAVQLDADIALAGGGNGGLALIAHVDVHTGEGDACGLTAIRVDGDVVFLRGSRNDGRAVRYSGSASLPDRLPAALGVYGDVALADVPGRRVRRHGQTGEKQQRKER